MRVEIPHRRVVAEIVDAGCFAASVKLAVAERHDDRILVLEDVARDAERRRQPELFHGDGERELAHQ
jgi:hypothetical protein